MDNKQTIQIRKIVGNFIKDLRENADPIILQKEVAHWIGNERTNYLRKENGKRPFSTEELLTIIVKFQKYYQKQTHLALDLTPLFDKIKSLTP